MAKKQDNMQPIADFLFEVGMLSHTPRSGFHFLGSGQQSVSEHVLRVIYAGYVLAIQEKVADPSKVMKMCLFHDLAEARTSDLNYVHQKYADKSEERALKDLTDTVNFGQDILDTVKEYEDRTTKEAIIAKDADNIEWILSLKEQIDIGNPRAKTWIGSAMKRLKTKSARKLAAKIIKTNSDHWWHGDGQDEWWVSRKRKEK
ncbi:MAG: HD domain-containing protein [bacterium]|nr:HD domain-containing protein [bacterium]